MTNTRPSVEAARDARLNSTDPAIVASQRARLNGHTLRYKNEGAAAARAALAPIRELVEKWLEPTQPGVIHNGAPDAETYSAAEFIHELKKLIYTAEELSND